MSHDGGVDEPDHLDVEAALAAITRRRGWPWQTPGRLSVGLDEHEQIVEYRANEDGQPVPVRVISPLAPPQER